MRLDCPMADCDTTIAGDTEEHVMNRAAEHARERHPDIDLDDETIEDLRSQIRTSP